MSYSRYLVNLMIVVEFLYVWFPVVYGWTGQLHCLSQRCTGQISHTHTFVNYDNELILYFCIVLFSLTPHTRTERDCVLQFVLRGLCQLSPLLRSITLNDY